MSDEHIWFITPNLIARLDVLVGKPDQGAEERFGGEVQVVEAPTLREAQSKAAKGLTIDKERDE